ncbi:hypothetical protein KSP40_PGU012287 [Platanthera guangdongensis]|uniref:Uncharacterized protein n=1 Tax=Platanthera guangdongensis TaxID=2320717 RepID=A0ABR2MGB3_9ASPA
MAKAQGWRYYTPAVAPPKLIQVARPSSAAKSMDTIAEEEREDAVLSGDTCCGRNSSCAGRERLDRRSFSAGHRCEEWLARANLQFHTVK